MKLSVYERQVLWNQLEIMQMIDPSRKEEVLEQQEILTNGYANQYDRVVHVARYGDELSGADAIFVHNVFDMMDGLFRYHSERGGKIRFNFDSFKGFDGNNEGDLYSYAKFLVEKQEKWEYLKIKNFNSHMPVRDIYQRMLDVWETYPPSMRVTSLTDAQVEEIRDAVNA